MTKRDKEDVAHHGGDDFVMILKDRTGEDRNPDEMHVFYAALRAVAEKHDFSICSYGSRSQIRRVFIRESPSILADKAEDILLGDQDD